MSRPIIVCALFVAATAVLGMQAASQTAQSNPYEGTSRPPADDQITTSTTPEAKPPAGVPLDSQPAETRSSPLQSRPLDDQQPGFGNSQSSFANSGRSMKTGETWETGNDDGIVHVASSPERPMDHSYLNDPDGDIVHPHARRSGEIMEGTTIRVRLLQRLSTVSSEKGDTFHTMVASDVLQGGQVVIPTGSEIDGRIMQLSTGHVGGHGSMRLSPETVTLPDGRRFQLHADVTATLGSRTRIRGESTITPGSRLKRDGIEYGGAVGGGLVAGAMLGGPAGAAAGGLIGAGVVTVHLMVSHPQATLESGTNMMLTLTEPLDMVPAASSGN